MKAPRTALAGLISLLGGGAGAVLGLVLAVVVGRLLDGAEAGYFFQLVALFTIAANVLELGADTGLVRQLSRLVSLRRQADLRRTVLVAVAPVVAVGLVVSGLLWLFAPALAGLIGGDRALLSTLISNAAWFVLPASLVTVLLGGTRGLGSVIPFTTLYNIGIPVGRVVAVGAALLAGFGVVAATQVWAWPWVSACAAACAVLLRQLRTTTAEPGSAPATPTRALAGEFWRFTAARGVGAAVEIGLAWLDVLIVGALLGPAAAGIYAITVRCAQSGLLVEHAMRMAVSPRVSAALATSDRASARTLNLGATRAMIMLAWPLFVTLAVFAPVVLPLFGDGFADGSTALALLCGAMLVLTGGGMVQTVLLMGGRSRWQLGNKGAALVVNVAANFALVPLLGIPGAALAWLLTVAVDTGLAWWQVHRRLEVHIQLRRLCLPVLLVLGTVAAPAVVVRLLVGATVPGLVVHLALVAVLYGAACWRCRHRLGLDALIRTSHARSVPQASRSST